jgi:FkbM family methyltransferase
MRWIRAWLRDGDVVVDSGANIGQMVLYFASMARTRVLAFEPLPSARAWLLECLQQQWGWNVEVLDRGLSERRGRVTLQMDGALSTTRLDWYAAKALERIEIEVDTLDSTLDAMGIERVRLWKLDMEGGEPQALRGARKLMMERRVDAVLIEVSGDSYAALKSALDDVGFRLVNIPNGPTVQEVGFGHGNLIALPAND